MGDYIDLLQASKGFFDPINQAAAQFRAIRERNLDRAEQKRQFDEAERRLREQFEAKLAEERRAHETEEGYRERALSLEAKKVAADVGESQSRRSLYENQKAAARRQEARRLETQPLEDESLRARSEEDRARADLLKSQAEDYPRKRKLEEQEARDRRRLDLIEHGSRLSEKSRKRYEKKFGVELSESAGRPSPEELQVIEDRAANARSRLDNIGAQFATLSASDTAFNALSPEQRLDRIEAYVEKRRDKVLQEEYAGALDNLETPAARTSLERRFRALGLGSPSQQGVGRSDAGAVLPGEQGPFSQSATSQAPQRAPGLASRNPSAFESVSEAQKHAVNPIRALKKIHDKQAAYQTKLFTPPPLPEAPPQPKPYPGYTGFVRRTPSGEYVPSNEYEGRPPDVIDMMQQEQQQAQPKLSPDQIKLILNQAFGAR